MTAAASRLAPARPSWQRLSLLASLLLLGWALLLPAGEQPRWWHGALAAALIVGFVGSWHGQHLSTTLRRWTPMTWRNRRQRAHRAHHHSPTNTPPHSAAEPRTPDNLHTRIVIHLRPHPHTLTTTADHDDQLPWDFLISWLHRYGVRADALTVCSLTRTPPASGLRSDAAAMLSGRTPQHRDTWLTYPLSAASNVNALTARRSALAHTDTSSDSDTPRAAALADTTARRLIAELRERGWLATQCEAPQELPQFVPTAATLRRECWTGAEYSDGFRAVYAIDPAALHDAVPAIASLGTKATWVAVTIRARGRRPASVEACVATLTSTRPQRQPVPGLYGAHGMHHLVASAMNATGLEQDTAVDAGKAGPVSAALTALAWPTAATGVPIGFNRNRQSVYLGLASPEPVRITVTGQPEFQTGIIGRLALSGLPVAIYTADPQRWVRMANHGGPQQFSIAPATAPPGAIIVSDASTESPPGPIKVTLRRPQSAPAPSTTIVITQDSAHPDLFFITTAHGNQWLSTRL